MHSWNCRGFFPVHKIVCLKMNVILTVVKTAAYWLSKLLVYRTNDDFNHLLLYASSSQTWVCTRISWRAWTRLVGPIPELLVQDSATHVRPLRAGLRILVYSLTWAGLAQEQRVEAAEKGHQYLQLHRERHSNNLHMSDPILTPTICVITARDTNISNY